MAARPKTESRVLRRASSPAETSARVAHIVEMMRLCQWVRGLSSAPLAKQWGVSVSRVEDLAAEAWRRVCAEANDAEQARPTIAGNLSVAMGAALSDKQWRAVASLGDTWSRVVGARAPEVTKANVTHDIGDGSNDDAIVESVYRAMMSRANKPESG